MALRQLVVDKKLSTLNEQLNELDFESLDKRQADLESAVDEAETNEELELIEEEANVIEAEKLDLNEKKEALEVKIADLAAELLELEEKQVATPQEGERTNMNKNTETRETINAFVRKEQRDFTTVEGALLIPREVLQPEKEFVESVDLSKHVNVVKVNHSAGSMPLIGHSDDVMVTVAELAANPKLSNPTIREIDYKIDTYRGYIPVSQEVIDDAAYDVTGLIRDEIVQQELNTKNAKILAELKGATAKAVAGVDGLKELLNVSIPRKYGRVAIVSSSLFNALDTAKDANGRYLLQDDVTSASGKNILGIKIEVLDDEVIGEAAGDMVGFFGDAKRAVTLFDRLQTTVKWIDYMHYGQMLAGFTRFQVKTTDANAGFYVTFTATPEV